MTRSDQGRNQLIERFLDGKHEQFDKTIAQLLARLKSNRDSISIALAQKSDIEADVEQLPKLLDQAKQFQTLGIDEKLEAIPKLEKEKQLSERADEEIFRVKVAIGTLQDFLPDTVFLSDTSLEGLPHAELLKQQRQVLDRLKNSSFPRVKPSTFSAGRDSDQPVRAGNKL